MSIFGEVISAQGAQAQEPRNEQDQRLKVQQFLQDRAAAQQAMQANAQSMQIKGAEQQQLQRQQQSQSAGMADYLSVLKNRGPAPGMAPGTGPDVRATGVAQIPEMAPLTFDTVSQSILKNKPNINPEEFVAAIEQFKPQFQQQDKMKLEQFKATARAASRGPGNVEEQIYATALKQGKSPEDAAMAAQLYKRAGVAEAGEAAGAKAQSKELVKFGTEINASADMAVAQNKSLDKIDTLAQGVDGGSLAELKTTASRWAQAFGMQPDQADKMFGSAADAGAIMKLQVGIASNATRGLTSRPAVFEFQKNLEATPGVQMLPAARKIVVSYMKELNNLTIDKQRTFQKWKKENPNGDTVDFDSAWNQKVINDHEDKFTELNDELKKATQAGGGQQQAPSQGAKQAPDGHWYLPDPNRPGKYLQVH